jgi:hypothetical protein
MVLDHIQTIADHAHKPLTLHVHHILEEMSRPEAALQEAVLAA